MQLCSNAAQLDKFTGRHSIIGGGRKFWLFLSIYDGHNSICQLLSKYIKYFLIWQFSSGPASSDISQVTSNK